MNWTTEKPTKEGYYWHSGLHYNFVPEVAHLDRHGDWDDDHDNPGRVIHEGDLWCGPIEPPPLPPDAHKGAKFWNFPAYWGRVYSEEKARELAPRMFLPTPIKEYTYGGPSVGWVETGELRANG